MTEEQIKQFRISVSKAKSFDGCQKQYKFNYIEKMPQKEWAHLTYGKFVHKALEEYHLHYLNNPGSTEPPNVVMAMAYKAAMAEFKGQMQKEQKLEAFEALSSYLKKLEKDKIEGKEAQVIACEKKFGIILDEHILLNGFIDQVQIDADGILTVIDFKTTKNKKYLQNDWFQLMTYAFTLMLEDSSLQEVRGGYMMIRHDFEVISKVFKRAEVMAIRDKFLDYADKINSEKMWRANPTFLCNYCSYLDICDEGKKLVHKDKFYGKTTW